MGFLADILGGTADEFYGALPSEIRNLYGSYGADGYTSGIPQVTAPQNISFQPYTVTS
jgi:hypothetical protein